MKMVSTFLSRRTWLLACTLLFVLHTLNFYRIPYLDRLDAWIYDSRLIAAAPKTLDPNVVIVDIDEASLSVFGRWPWSRHTIAELVTKLTHEQQVAALGFDMVFAEAETPSADQALVHALQNQPVVLGYYLTSDRAAHVSGLLPKPIFQTPSRDFQVTSWSGYGANLSILTEAAAQSGFFNAVSDPDGVIRSAPLIAEFQGKNYESLALALYRRFRAVGGVLPIATPHFAQANYAHLDSVQLGSTESIAVDDTVTKLIPYRGAGGATGGSFTYISAKDLLQNKLRPESLKGKVVLIGSSAPALEDFRVTPFGQSYPGVEVQANLVSGLINGHTPTRPDYARGFDVFQLLVLSALLLTLLPRLSALFTIALTFALVGGLWLLHSYLFSHEGIVLPSAAGIALIICAFIINSSHGFFLESRRRHRLTRLFGSYVSPKWVNRMAQSTNDYSMQASNQVLTVMFCDMHGFTSLAGKLEPLALQTLLNDIFNRLSHVIQAHGGTIDKYMGDCVMAFWGAPEGQPDHAARAVRCAKELQIAIQIYNQTHTATMPEVQMGIGINTGLMCVGDMGSDIRRSYTVIGEAVNVAARLESLCRAYNQRMIVSAATREAVQNEHWQDLGLVAIAGSAQPIHIFTLNPS